MASPDPEIAQWIARIDAALEQQQKQQALKRPVYPDWFPYKDAAGNDKTRAPSRNVFFWTERDFSFEQQAYFAQNVCQNLVPHGYWSSVYYVTNKNPTCHCVKDSGSACCHTYRSFVTIGKN